MSVNLSVIIVSFNTRDLLRSCIKSVYQTVRNVDFEILVADNGSNDGSPEMIEAEFKYVKLVRNEENVGFAKANNQAMRVANGRYVLLLNSDTILRDEAIEKLVMFMDKHPEAAAVGPKILNYDGTLQNKGNLFPSPYLSLIRALGINLLSDKVKEKLFPRFHWNADECRQVDWLSGCCMLVSKNILQDIGFMSEDFFLYCEEVEWCYRARRKKYQVWYIPHAEVIHLNRSSSCENRDEIFDTSRLIYWEKIGRWQGVFITLISILSLMLTYVLNKINHSEQSGTATQAGLRSEIRFLKKLLQIPKGDSICKKQDSR
jgi:GT2 family glycosyltransferase